MKETPDLEIMGDAIDDLHAYYAQGGTDLGEDDEYSPLSYSNAPIPAPSPGSRVVARRGMDAARIAAGC